MKFRKVLYVLVAFTVLLSLTACGSGNDGNNTAADTQNGSSAAQTSTPAEQTVKTPVNLQLMLDNGDETRKLINTKYIQTNLEKELPDFKVDVQLIPANYGDKIKVLNSTGELPDVFFSGGTMLLPPLISSNSLTDLLPYITKDGFADKYKMKNLINPWQDGKLYTFDAGSDAYFVPRIYYNKDIFTQNNITVPVTFDDFMKACTTLKSKGIVPVALYGKDGWAVGNCLLTMLICADNPDVYNQLIAGKADFSNQVVQDALKRVQTMVNEGVFQTGVTTMEYGDVENMFTSKKAAMYIMNSWEQANLEKVDPDVDFMNFPQVNPQIDIGKVTQIYGAPLKGYAVSSLSKNVDAAVKLAEYCVMQEAKFFNQEQKSPAGLETGIELQGVSPLMQKNLDSINACTTKVNVLYYNLLNPKANTDLNVVGAKLLTGKYSPEQFAKDFNGSFADGMKAQQ